MDTDKLQTLGIPLTDAYNTLQTFLGGLYVNDFNQFGHTWQVLMQAEPEFRDQPRDIGRFYVRNSTGDMVPLSTLATVSAVRRARRGLPLQPLPRDPDSGRSRAGLLQRAGERRDGGGRERSAAAGLRLRMDRHHLSGEAGAGQRRRDLRLRGGAGVPVPGRAV